MKIENIHSLISLGNGEQLTIYMQVGIVQVGRADYRTMKIEIDAATFRRGNVEGALRIKPAFDDLVPARHFIINHTGLVEEG